MTKGRKPTGRQHPEPMHIKVDNCTPSIKPTGPENNKKRADWGMGGLLVHEENDIFLKSCSRGTWGKRN